MRPLLGLGLTLLLALGAAGFSTSADRAGSAMLALGFVLIVAFWAGRWVLPWGLPAVTGYMMVGLAFGPHVAGRLHPALTLLSHDAVDALQLLDAVALGLIAMGAGGELKLPNLRARAPVIGAVIALQVLLVLGGVTVAVYFGRGWFPLLGALTPAMALAVALLYGTTALANSPAVALAVVQETRARGPVSEVVLAVTVAKDVVVIALFTIVLGLAAVLTDPDGTLGASVWLGPGWEVFGSVAMGAALGWLAVQYLQRLGHELPLLVLGVAFAAVALLPNLHLSGVLACMVAGFYIENFSDHGEDLMRAIERHALPVYVVFFTIAGAVLDLDALRATWPLALSLVLLRLLLTTLGTVLGGALGRAPRPVLTYGWSGFVAQAGVTLGFAAQIGERLPQVGDTVQTVLLAVVALNQIAGPVLFRLGLTRAGEVGAQDALGEANGRASAGR